MTGDPIMTVSVYVPPPQGGEFQLAPDVILVMVKDGSARLLDLGGYLCSLSDTAAMMLVEVLRDGVAAAAERVGGAFAADPGDVRRDLDALLRRLRKLGLVIPAGRPRRGVREAVLRGAALLGAALAARLPRGPRALERGAAPALLALATVSTRLFGWSRTVAAWRRCFPVAVPDGRWDGADAASAIDAAIREAAAAHPLNVTCKERSLACWASLRQAGFPAEMMLGIDLYPLSSHAWCRLGARTLTDYEDRCRRFAPVLSYA
jgi:hypothetical protein